jgi:hypothetical protein
MRVAGSRLTAALSQAVDRTRCLRPASAKLVPGVGVEPTRYRYR